MIIEIQFNLKYVLWLTQNDCRLWLTIESLSYGMVNLEIQRSWPVLARLLADVI